jgi:valyl-tRNA synthetase
VTEIRRFRSDQGLRPGQRVPARLKGIETTPLAAHEASIRSLLRLTDLADNVSASLTTEGVTVEIDLAGTVDVAAERARMEKDLAAARKEAAQMAAKLGNSGFTDKAPADVVAKSRQRQADAEADIARLEARLASLS